MPDDTITMLLAELVNAEGALQRLGARSLPIKLAYRIARLSAIVGAETRPFVQQRTALIVKYGVARPATPAEAEAGQPGEITEVRPENLSLFMTELRGLGEMPVTLTTQWLLSIDLLGEIDMTPADLGALGALLRE